MTLRRWIIVGVAILLLLGAALWSYDSYKARQYKGRFGLTGQTVFGVVAG